MNRSAKQVAAAPNPYLDLTAVQLADALGDLDAAEEVLKARIKRAREVAELRGLHRLVGTKWIVTRVISGIDRLDARRMKNAFGLEWYAQWTKPGTRTTWTATPIVDVAPPQASPPGSTAPPCAT